MKKKIAFLLHDPDIKSGATRSAIDLINNLKKNDEVSILVISPSLNSELEEALKGINIIQLMYFTSYRLVNESKKKRLKQLPKRLIKEIITKLSTYKLNKIIKEYDVDTVVTNTSVLKLGAYLKKINPKIKHIWHIREYGIEDQNLVLLGGETKLYELLNSYCDHAIFISNSLSQKFLPHIKNLDYSIIYDDISSSYIIENKLKFEPYKPIKLMMVGRVSKGKGQLEVIKEIKKVKDLGIPVTLDLIGDDTYDQNYSNQIKNYLQRNSLDTNVNFLGIRRDVNNIRANYIFEIIASPYEAFGRVTVEGMLSRHLVIGLNRGATAELITDNKTGLLYKENQLSEKLVAIFNNQIDVNKIREEGFREALKYTEGRAALKLLKILETLD